MSDTFRSPSVRSVGPLALSTVVGGTGNDHSTPTLVVRLQQVVGDRESTEDSGEVVSRELNPSLTLRDFLYPVRHGCGFTFRKSYFFLVADTVYRPRVSLPGGRSPRGYSVVEGRQCLRSLRSFWSFE